MTAEEKWKGNWRLTRALFSLLLVVSVSAVMLRLSSPIPLRKKPNDNLPQGSSDSKTEMKKMPLNSYFMARSSHRRFISEGAICLWTDVKKRNGSRRLRKRWVRKNQKTGTVRKLTNKNNKAIIFLLGSELFKMVLATQRCHRMLLLRKGILSPRGLEKSHRSSILNLGEW